MPDLTVKTGDTHPPITATLTDSAGAVDLTTADSVRFVMKSGATVVEGACTVTNAVAGEVEYDWAAGDTDVAGTYEVEFEVTWNVGEIETFPNDGYKEIELLADLD